jgi:hypothetical protein
MTRLDDAELLDTLAAALAPPTASPPPAERAHLRQLLTDAETVAPIVPLRKRRWNRASLVRHPVAAAAVVVVLATSSATAAAVGTDTLPGPLHTIAVGLGIPVPPSGLDAAHAAMATLATALASGNTTDIARDLTALRAAVAALNATDLASVKDQVDELIDRADLALGSATAGAGHSGATSGPDADRGHVPGSGDATSGGRRSESDDGSRGDSGSSASGDDVPSGEDGSKGGPGPSDGQDGSPLGSINGSGGPGPTSSGGASSGSGESSGEEPPPQTTSGTSGGSGGGSNGGAGSTSGENGSGGGGSSPAGTDGSGNGGGGSGAKGGSGPG